MQALCSLHMSANLHKKLVQALDQIQDTLGGGSPQRRLVPDSIRPSRLTAALSVTIALRKKSLGTGRDCVYVFVQPGSKSPTTALAS